MTMRKSREQRALERIAREQKKARHALELERHLEIAETEHAIPESHTSVVRIIFGVLTRNDHVLANVAHNALRRGKL